MDGCSWRCVGYTAWSWTHHSKVGSPTLKIKKISIFLNSPPHLLSGFCSEIEEIVLGLLRNVFHMLRQDGIVVLLHVYDDQYMLVSKEKVIKKAIREAKQQCNALLQMCLCGSHID